MTVDDLVFLPLGLVVLGSAIRVVTCRQLVHAGLWLCVCLGALAGCYLMLTSELLAWVQILIYVGAITVLLLFAVMLTRAPIGRAADLDGRNRLLAAALATGLAVLLVPLLVGAFGSARIALTDATAGAPATVGTALFRTWVLPFELLSVLLLAALIGAIVLSRPQPGD
jgi:NADH-quinone oxidoreductase subunit J